MITASSLHRAKACPGSVSLSPVVDRATDDSRRGVAIHRYLQLVVEAKKRGEDVEECWYLIDDEHRAACKAIDLDRLPSLDGAEWFTEAAMAYRVADGTATHIEAEGRAYPREEGMIYGTADLLGFTKDRAIVVDYKTGWGDVDEAKANLQVGFYALAACRARCIDSATVAIIRVRDDGSVFYDVADLDSMALLSIEADVHRVFNDTRRDRFVEGDHCRYCKVFDSCPAKTSLAMTLASPEHLELSARLTPETAAKAWVAMKAARKVLDRIEDTVREFASRTPIDIGGGKVLGEKDSARESISGTSALAVLTRDMPDIVDDAIDIVTSKSRIESAIKKHCAHTGEKVAPKMREILAALRANGAVKTHTTTSVREFKGSVGLAPSLGHGPSFGSMEPSLSAESSDTASATSNQENET